MKAFEQAICPCGQQFEMNMAELDHEGFNLCPDCYAEQMGMSPVVMKFVQLCNLPNNRLHLTAWGRGGRDRQRSAFAAAPPCGR